jgi:hypothetical protein
MALGRGMQGELSTSCQLCALLPYWAAPWEGVAFLLLNVAVEAQQETQRAGVMLGS